MHEVGIISGDPVFMVGGAVFDEDFILSSCDMFQQDSDGLANWHRPACTDPDACGISYCNPEGPDSVCAPLSGTYPGRVVFDNASLYTFYDDGVFALSGVNPTLGFQQLPDDNPINRFGRIVYVRGTVSGGCWFSTDWSADDVWVTDTFDDAIAYSRNAFSTARSATGPWFQSTAPWQPRAGAAVVLGPDKTKIYVAAGLDFNDGLPTGIVFGDAWSVDASVCLLSEYSGLVCNGHGTPNIDDITCDCDPGYQATDRCDLPSPSPSSSSTTSLSSTPTATPSSSNTPGESDSNTGTPSSTLTPTRTATRSRTASRSHAPVAPAGAATAAAVGLSPGAAAGISIVAIGVGLAGGLYVFATFFGGGPLLSSIGSSISVSAGSVAKSMGISGGERASLLRAPGTPTIVTQNAAADRFRGMGSYGPV